MSRSGLYTTKLNIKKEVLRTFANFLEAVPSSCYLLGLSQPPVVVAHTAVPDPAAFDHVGASLANAAAVAARPCRPTQAARCLAESHSCHSLSISRRAFEPLIKALCWNISESTVWPYIKFERK